MCVSTYKKTMETILKRKFLERGLKPRDAARAGCSYNTLMGHLHGTRKISAESALRYEALLGIPRWELRPDLWLPEHYPAKRRKGKSTDAEGRL